MKKQDAQKVAIVSVTNDLVADHRVHKTCMYLCEKGYRVLLVGRKLRDSLPIQRSYKTYRMRLLFRKKFCFYAEYNIRLFLFLLFKKAHLLVSNDLDTLPANFLTSRIKKIPLLYDSHEYFTEVPELIHRKRVQNIWQRIESYIVPRLTVAITVNESLAEMYTQKYGTPFYTIRNVPEYQNSEIHTIDKQLFFPTEVTHVLLYQGSLNVGRGIEALIDTIPLLDKHFGLLIIGSGDIDGELKERVIKLNLQERVRFLGKMPFEQLRSYTAAAFLGFSLEENKGLNYYYALPNKLFDYIHAGVPVVCSNFPEMKRIIESYQIGVTLDTINAEKLAETIKNIERNIDLYQLWKKNCKTAALELNWDKEKTKFDRCLEVLGV